MITIGIDDNNDIYLDKSRNIGIKRDINALGDIYINKIQTVKGELAYNTEKGVDYFNTILGDPCYLDLFQNDVINELKDTDNTISVNNYQTEISNGIYAYTVDCNTTYGTITING